STVAPGWLTVNGGDGGYNAINPGNPTQWFTSNIFVSIQSCLSGVNFNGLDFQTIVDSNTLEGDQGAFYTPYILDSQASNRMIVGTCRVWNGNTDGTGFSPSSFNFDTSTAAACTGFEANLVSALAAGGPASGGNSSVNYAGTSAGQIFATSDAAGGPFTWADVTPPGTAGFRISDVALDPSDLTGQTAYATVMGFG